MSDPAAIAEQRETIDRLIAAGHGRLLAALEDPDCYSREKGEVVFARLGKRLKCGPQKAKQLLMKARAEKW